jgi:DNA mismatch endonuclease, patch repair protein
MPEQLSNAQRSRVMATVKSQDTLPELRVRRLVHRMGFRYRLHGRDLPGTPDIVLPRLRKVINVHGCFWHAHRCRHGRRRPVSNSAYWRNKLRRNVIRDRQTRKRLHRAGWSELVVWECELRAIESAASRIFAFLRGDSSPQQARRPERRTIPGHIGKQPPRTGRRIGLGTP